MVRTGLAIAYRKYSNRYVRFENTAKANRVGMWQGNFVKPWEWRNGIRLQRLNSRSCPVKGNVNSKGNKIYHLPSGLYYQRVQIREDQGDKCFSTEMQAIEFGFRKSKR